MNKPFLEWKAALKAFRKRGPIKFRRLEQRRRQGVRLPGRRAEGRSARAVDDDDGAKKGLKFLRTPQQGAPASPPRSWASRNRRRVASSASHTINGHSVILRITLQGLLLPAERRPERRGGTGADPRAQPRRPQPPGGSLQSAAPRIRGLLGRVSAGGLTGHLGRVVRRRKRAQGIHPPARDADGGAWASTRGSTSR